MMHTKRRWSVSSIATAEELAHMLTERTWTLCSGFCVANHETYLFLNDSTDEDSAAEFACVKILGPSQWLQIESITFSWMPWTAALETIQAALRGDYDGHDFARPLDLGVRLDRGQTHRCHLCA